MLSEYRRIKVGIYNQKQTMESPYISIIMKIVSKLPIQRQNHRENKMIFLNE